MSNSQREIIAARAAFTWRTM